MEESGEELIRIKECYVQLSEESRSLEEKLKEQFEKEKQVLLSEASLHIICTLENTALSSYKFT